MGVVRYTQLLLFAGVLLLISACASGAHDKKPQAESLASAGSGNTNIDVTAQSPVHDLSVAPGNFVANNGVTYADMALSQSNGSVQIFPLDQTTPAPMENNLSSSIATTALDPSAGASPQAQMPKRFPPAPSKGVAYAGDSSVTVFPLDQATPPAVAAGFAVASGPDDLTPLPRQITDMGPNAAMMPPEREPKVARESGRHLMEKVYFKNGSADLTPLMANLIEQLAVEARNGRMIRIEGHASRRAKSKDPIEARITNLKMSMERAMAVSQALIRRGVPAPSISTTALGDSVAAASDKPDMDAESAARRVDIIAQ